MSDRPTVAHESKNEAPPAGLRDIAAEPIADEPPPADNRYAPASGILTPVHAPLGEVR